jgi:hypothetical protein
MPTCEVCCERMNRSDHKQITCPYCPFQACTACSERYLCETVQDAHCMACKKGWDREILTSNFTNKFVTRTYKHRREDLLFDRERSLMPATQPYVEMEIRIRKINKEIVQLKLAIDESTRKVNRMHMGDANRADIDERINQMAAIFEEQKVGNRLRLDVQFLEWQRDFLMGRMYGGDLTVQRRQFVRACPYTDCKGFLSTAWKCGLCEMWTCPDCHEGRGADREAEHTCNPDSLETAKMLDRDSRNCPKCAAMIFKIDGCDQMFCTQCHTAFSWRRGTIETGTIHNPHYYDYMRRHGGGLPRNPGDVPCGGVPGWHGLAMKLRLRESPWFTHLSCAHRSIAHTQHVLIPRYTTDVRTDNRDLRIKYMIGDLPDEEFKKKIQQRDKARQRKADIRQVCEMVVAVMTDLFQALDRTSDITTFVNSVNEFRDHVTRTLAKISVRWSNCVTPTFNANFEFV